MRYELAYTLVHIAYCQYLWCL